MRQTLVSWAATSCFLILAVVALRAAFGRRMGAGLRYALWGVVLVRLLVPVQLFTSPVVGTVIESESIVTKETKTEREVLDALGGQDGPQAVATAAPYFPAAPAMPDPPTVPDTPVAPDWREIPAALGWAWLAGSAVTAVVLLGCNLNFWLRLRRTRRPLEEQRAHDVRPYTHLPVYTAQGLPSPCLFGVFRPAIYVAPETAADPAALRHVLAHEGTHASHGDHVWSLLRCAALCVHWWNPLVWLAAKLSRRDGELACDEGALKRLGDEERTAYGNTLLALVTGKAVPGGPLLCSTAMTGDKKSLKERFARIAQAPRRAAGIAAAAVILAALVTVCAFGQKTSAPTPWEELEADLSLTVEEDGTVRITGTVDGTELPRGAFWWPDDYLFSESPYGELSLIYPAFTDGIEGHLLAWWADEGHTAVNLSTRMTAALSSYAPTGYWEFTVDLSGETAKLTRMEAVTGMLPNGTLSDGPFPEGAEVRMYPKTISDEDAVRVGRIAAKLLTAAEECYRDWEEKGNAPVEPVETAEPPAPPEESSAPVPPPAQELSEMTELPYHPDLDRDGVQERFELANIPAGEGGPGQRLTVWSGKDEPLWSEKGYYVHPGWNALFLCTLDGEDCLLRYHPTMGQGSASYTYTLFTLSPDGKEQVVRENSVLFDTNDYGQFHRFDPEEIAAFMDEVNDLLENSVQLLNTDGGLLKTFAKEGRLYDSLGWLDLFISRTKGSSLLDELRAFADGTAAPPAPSEDLSPAGNAQAELKAALLGETDFILYRENGWGYTPTVDITTAPPRAFDALSEEWEKYNSFAVVDLDGDGVEEVVYHVTDVAGDAGGYLILRWAGAGDVRCYVKSLHTTQELKADGSFDFGYLGVVGSARLSFSVPGVTFQEEHFLVHSMDLDTGDEAFYIGDETVTQEEFDAAWEKQHEKPDAEWYDFTPENVKKALG